MRRPAIVVAAVVVVVATALTGCTGGDAPALPSAGGPVDSQAPGATPTPLTIDEYNVRLGRCVREHGQEDFPDEPAQGQSVKVDDAVVEACLRLLGPPPPPPEGDLEGDAQRWLAVARCMRAHGFAEFPDENRGSVFFKAGGPEPASTTVDGAVQFNFDNPAVRSAWEACVAETQQEGQA